MNYEAETQWENDNQALRHIRYPVVHNELYKNRLLVVKDRICDWIYYHHCQPDRDLVDIRDLVFTKKVSGRAYATYLDNKYCGQYLFIVSFDNDKKGVYLDVIDNSVERYAQLTFQWNGLTCLGFDKKGYSYELTTKEYNYLEKAKNPALKLLDD